MGVVFLVPCTRKKLQQPAAARDLYLSRRFLKARRLAERFASEWFVLSGKYGLIHPNTIVQPYDFRLGAQPERDQRKWGQKVAAAVCSVSKPCDEIVILGDDEYARCLVPELLNSKRKVFQPLLFRSRRAQHDWLDEMLTPGEWSTDLNDFYALMKRLQHGVGELPRLRDCSGGVRFPKRGIYFFFDEEEHRWMSPTLRVVRVGTHAVSRGSGSNLWTRLRTHRGTQTLGGNHRSSVFRLHVGAALLTERALEPSYPTWGKGQSASTIVRDQEVALEQMVSSYIGSLRVLWLEVRDEPSPLSDRSYLEQNSIGLLSGPSGPLDVPSARWLGLHSPHIRIRSTGLWNLDYIGTGYDRRLLDVLELYVSAAEGARPAPITSVAPASWSRGRTPRATSQLRFFESE